MGWADLHFSRFILSSVCNLDDVRGFESGCKETSQEAAAVVQGRTKSK